MAGSLAGSRGRDPLLRGFAERVSRSPDDPVLVCGTRRISPLRIERLAETASEALRRARLEPGSLVALRAPNGAGFLALLLATLREELVPLLLDAAGPETEEERIHDALGVTARLSCDPWPETIGATQLETIRGGREGARLEPGRVLKLTSGSTGAPRAVVAPSASLVADAEGLARSMKLAPDERYLANIPFSHSYGLSSLVVPALVHDAVLLLPEEPVPHATFHAARTGEATVFPTTPAFLSGLLRLSRRLEAGPSLRTLISAGAPLRPRLAREVREAYGLPAHVFYGASECGGICYDRTGQAAERGSVGTPVDGVTVELHDDSGRPHADEGRVVVRSDRVASGYHPDADPALEGGRFLTSDAARWRDGELVLRGRCDDLINVRGLKVNPGEVEEVLLSIRGVREAAVVGLEDEGRGTQTVRAVLACDPGTLTYMDVVGHCASRLAPFKIPRSVLFVEELPRNARGKVDRGRLGSLRPGTGSGAGS